jgi:hydroxymethylglutaryl-CoA lyase
LKGHKIKITECPRDAMQGIKEWIPTESKVRYINQLLKVGFDMIDFGSFVSPKAIPQMRDTGEVLNQLLLSQTESKLLAIVANQRGAYDAVEFEEIDFLGFPFSISETFQVRNTNSTIEESLHRVADIQSIAIKNRKKLLVYISMGFGNPYGDKWNVEIVEKWARQLSALGVRYLSLSDTIGVSTPDSIEYLFSHLIPALPEVQIGAHLHTTPNTWLEKIQSAHRAGCIRFDGAIKGYGGCPMAKDDLTGNMPTEKMVEYFTKLQLLDLNKKEFDQSMLLAGEVFPQGH